MLSLKLQHLSRLLGTALFGMTLHYFAASPTIVPPLTTIFSTTSAVAPNKWRSFGNRSFKLESKRQHITTTTNRHFKNCFKMLDALGSDTFDDLCPPPPEPAQSQFSCPDCGTTFRDQKRCITHRATVHGWHSPTSPYLNHNGTCLWCLKRYHTPF